MWKISKEFHFSASHQLRNLPKDHQCARLHGHNYILRVELTGDGLDNTGFVIDYGELSFIKNWVDIMDHRHLNDLFNFNPTSENICFYLWEEIHHWLKTTRANLGIRVLGVSLSETPKTWATYESNRQL